MAEWPLSLPCQPVLDGLGFTDEPNVVEFKPDIGRAQRSKRYTRDRELIEASIKLDAAQMETLRTFYRDDCESGVVAFTMKDWRIGPAGFTFANPPRYNRVNGRAFMAQLTLYLE